MESRTDDDTAASAEAVRTMMGSNYSIKGLLNSQSRAFKESKRWDGRRMDDIAQSTTDEIEGCGGGDDDGHCFELGCWLSL